MSEKQVAATSAVLDVSDGSQMHAYVARPAPGSPPCGLMLFQEAFGVNHHIRTLADRHAGAGFLTIAPELYHRTAPAGFECSYTDFAQASPHYQAMTQAGTEADIRAAFAWLHQENRVAPEKTAAVGYCLGGRVATQAATVLPISAAASYYGGNLMSLRSDFASLHCPLMLVWGGQDSHIPLAQRIEVGEAIRAEGKSLIETTFSDAGHGFFCDERSAYHAPSAHVAWSLTLAFLHQNLAS